MKYFVISNSDGDTRINEIDGDLLQKRLAKKDYGDAGFMTEKDLAKNSDTNCWNEKILIIKGEIVVPQPIQTVTEYKL